MTDIDVMTGELVPVRSSTLFHTDDPAQVLQEARGVAQALKTVLDDGGMVQKIGRNEHVRVEGWQTLGSMLGVSAHVVWSRPIPGGWEAKAEARTLDGRTVGAAEAMVTHEERNWRHNDEYALRSMAQTRAMSKALKGPLGFIMVLAGKDATPAEEMITGEPYGPPASARDSEGTVRAVRALYNTTDIPLDKLAGALEADAGGYLPRIVARALMLVAAHRPDRDETGTVPQDAKTKDATETGATNPDTAAEDPDITETTQPPDQ